MIQKPKNWDSVQEFSDRPKLPLDAYVCRVKQVSFADTNYGPQLLVLFDIEEGEQRGFFSKEFKANTIQDKKWKGVLRPFRAMSADRVRSGEYTLPPDKPLKKAAAPSNGFAAIPDNGPLPWDNDSGDGPLPF